MDPDTAIPSSALATALIAGPLADEEPATELARATGSAALGTPASTGSAINPAELLASLMDFPGSVALAELLEGEVRPEPRTRPAQARALQSGSLAERLLLDAQARLDSLESLVLKPLSGRRAPAIPTPSDLLFSLGQHGLLEAGQRSTQQVAIRRFADDLGMPFRSALGLSLRQAQAQVATLRWEITHDLRALGPRADELERLDAAISRSMQAKLGELLDRMEHAAHLTFVRACVHAVEALPEPIDEEALAAWCDPNGWLVRYRERCVRMAKALYGHLRRNLEGLMRAASDNDDWMGDP